MKNVPPPPTGAAAAVDGRHIVLRALMSADANERCRTVPDGRFGRDTQQWEFPATPTTAHFIWSAWSRKAGGPGLLSDAAFAELLHRRPHWELAAAAKGLGEQLPNIPTINKDAWSWQREAYWFQRELPAALLAIGMGGGKSLITVGVAGTAGADGGPAGATLILCPPNVVPVWGGTPATPYSARRPGQFELHSTLDFDVLPLDDTYENVRAKQRAADRALLQAQRTGRPLVVVRGYQAAIAPPLGPGYVLRQVKERGVEVEKKVKVDDGWLTKLDWDLLVCDESHMLKAPTGVTSTFVAQVAARSNRRLLLTGTPWPHDCLDAFAQLRLVDPGLVGTGWTKFRDRYAIMGGFEGRQVLGFRNVEELNERFYRVSYRIDDEELHTRLGLPDVQDLEAPFTLSARSRRIYQQMEEQLLADLGRGVVTAANGLVRLLRLAQITDGFVALDPEDGEAKGKLEHFGTEKQDAFQERLEMLAPHEKVAVFCRFTAALDQVQEVCRKLKRDYVELSGRRKELARWQGGAAPVLGVQLKAGGVGVDLSMGCYAFYYDKDFDRGAYEQTRKRQDRPGQTRSVTNIHMMGLGTMDEVIQAALTRGGDVVRAALVELRRTSPLN